MLARKQNKWLILAGVALVILPVLGFAAIKVLGAFSGPFDNEFGDQHLKTTVALLELYKLRFGAYPATLRDIKYTGEWDQIALQSVRYCPNATRTAYYVEVTRGWAARPHLAYPPAFWKGTGYNAALKSACP